MYCDLIHLTDMVAMGGRYRFPATAHPVERAQVTKESNILSISFLYSFASFLLRS